MTDTCERLIAPRSRDTGSSADGRYLPFVVVIGALTGAALRLFILSHALRALDSDEAVAGLMARHFLHGEHTVFFWGQAYGGSLESIVAAVPFAIFGSSALALKLVPLAFDACAAVLVWRIGRRLISPRAGSIAAVAFWMWPASYVWWSTKARDYCSVLALGLVMSLIALRIIERENRRWDWVVFGLAGGLGWWVSPQVVYLAFPAVLWIGMRNRRALRFLPIAMASAVIGALPWLVWNLHHHWDSLKPPSAGLHEGYFGHLARFVRIGLPMALGLRVPYEERWLFRPVLAIALYVLVVAAGVLVVGRAGRRAALMAVAIVLYPFLWALSPLSGYVGEGRYLFLLSPLLALVVGLVASTWWRTAGILVALLVLTVGGLSAMHAGNSPYESNRTIPVSMSPLIRDLEGHQQLDVFTTYWIAYRLDFESRERIVSTPMAGPVRWAAYDNEVRSSPDPVYVFVTGSKNDGILALELARLRVGYQHYATGGFSVYQPSRRVLPDEIHSISI